MSLFMDSWYMMVRYLRGISRSPFAIGMTLIQPILWMLLFSSLFSSIIHIPGFSADAYIDFLSPGIVVMSTLMAGSYAGMGMIGDYRQGVLNRFLVSPVHRPALIFGPLLQNVVTMSLQASIMIVLALLIGARFEGGILGILMLIMCSVLLGVSLGALSMALGLLIRKEEALTSAVGFTAMPLMFLSGLFLPIELAPGWMQTMASFNPVHWATEAGREALGSEISWGFVMARIGYLFILLIFSSWLATRAFRRYQRSV